MVCKEAAMKPLRRLMMAIEQETDFEAINWSEAAEAMMLRTELPTVNWTELSDYPR